MNKREFLQSLREKLTQMPEEEVNAALRYYEEYFDEAGVQNEERVLKELGTPEQVAKQILAEGGVREEKKGNSEGKGKMTMWIAMGIVLCVIVIGASFRNYNREKIAPSNGSAITGSNTNGTEKVKGKYIDVEEGVEDFASINVEADMLDVEIKEGTEYKVVIHYWSEDEMTYEVKNNVLECVQKNTKEINNRKNTMTIYVPAKRTLNKIDIDMGMGNNKLNNISATEIVLENGMGDFEATDVNFDKVDAELGMGEAKLIGTVNGDIKIDNGMGNIKVDLVGESQKYNYELENGFGDIEVDGKKYSDMKDVKEDHNASYNIKVSTGMGNIKIEFK